MGGGSHCKASGRALTGSFPVPLQHFTKEAKGFQKSSWKVWDKSFRFAVRYVNNVLLIYFILSQPADREISRFSFCKRWQKGSKAESFF